MCGEKCMHEKVIVGCTAIALSLLFQGVAYSIPTKWERIEVSLSELLSSGWQLIASIQI
jgi:hypothetical protein